MFIIKSLLKEVAESVLRMLMKRSVPANLKRRYTQECDGLTVDGFYVINNFMSKEECDDLIREIDGHIESNKSNVWTDTAGADNRIYFIDTINEKFKDFYNTPYFREVLQAYTGIEKPKGMLLAGRIDAVEGNLGSGGGWHRDSPVHHQTKAICYLSDVNEDNGPFQYIPGSHSKASVIKSYLKKTLMPGQYRFTEAEIENYVRKMEENIVEMTADAGTLLFADTKGIHRGKPITCGSRYVLFCYLWGGEIPAHFDKLKQNV